MIPDEVIDLDSSIAFGDTLLAFLISAEECRVLKEEALVRAFLKACSVLLSRSKASYLAGFASGLLFKGDGV